MSERVIPYTRRLMPGDLTEELLERWRSLNPDLGLEAYQVTARLSRVALHVSRSQDAVFARFGLNRGEVGVLSAMRTARPGEQLTPTKLFKGLMLSSAGMTSRLDRLEERGLIRRVRDPKDRRAISLLITATGRRLVDQAVAANTVEERKLVAALTRQEAKALAGLLQKLLDRLESVRPVASDRKPRKAAV